MHAEGEPFGSVAWALVPEVDNRGCVQLFSGNQSYYVADGVSLLEVECEVAVASHDDAGLCLRYNGPDDSILLAFQGTDINVYRRTASFNGRGGWAGVLPASGLNPFSVRATIVGDTLSAWVKTGLAGAWVSAGAPIDLTGTGGVGSAGSVALRVGSDNFFVDGIAAGPVGACPPIPVE
jgi:hypothetical protein